MKARECHLQYLGGWSFSISPRSSWYVPIYGAFDDCTLLSRVLSEPCGSEKLKVGTALLSSGAVIVQQETGTKRNCMKTWHSGREQMTHDMIQHLKSSTNSWNHGIKSLQNKLNHQSSQSLLNRVCWLVFCGDLIEVVIVAKLKMFCWDVATVWPQ